MTTIGPSKFGCNNRVVGLRRLGNREMTVIPILSGHKIVVVITKLACGGFHKSSKRTANMMLNVSLPFMGKCLISQHLNETEYLIRQNKSLNSLLQPSSWGHLYCVLLFTWKGCSYLVAFMTTLLLVEICIFFIIILFV